MNVTSAWVPISSAVAALFGGGFGAWLQGRYGVSGWRRQVRLDAYTGFLNATHDFDSCLTNALNAIGKSDFDEKWNKTRDAARLLQRAGSLVSIAGPLSIDKAAQEVEVNARSIIRDGESPDTIAAIGQAQRNNQAYEKRIAWIGSAEAFADVCRRVLKTQ
jgi:hypothetical protein